MTDTCPPTCPPIDISGPTGTLEHLDPHVLTLELNVRDTAELDADFVASVAEHGVLIPIAAVRDHNGTVRVRAGQRRTLAAREAGLATVPVYVRPATPGDGAARITERIGEQIVENDQRRGLSDAQRARGIRQMIDAGLSAAKVAKKLSTSREVVKAAATAATSATAMAALRDGQLSLAEAAAITEFEGMPGPLGRLLGAAGTSTKHLSGCCAAGIGGFLERWRKCEAYFRTEVRLIICGWRNT
jgi:ParB family chromosome partitioning protein